MSPMKLIIWSTAIAAALIFPASAVSAAESAEENERDRIWSVRGNSPGASLELGKKHRKGNVITFGLRASGLPLEQKYTLLQWPMTMRAPLAMMKSVVIDSGGIVMCLASDGSCGPGKNRNEPVSISSLPTPGESFRYLLVSQLDSNLHAFAMVVPLPNEGKDRGCHLQAVRLTATGSLMQLEGSGFEPGAELEMESNSAGEIIRAKSKAEPDGTYRGLLAPEVIGKDGGINTVVLRSGKCAPKVTFGWGRQVREVK
jgi:hypothetical protein